MRELPARFERVWRRGDFTGDQRPVRRVTVQRPQMSLRTYEVRSTFRNVPASPFEDDPPSNSPYPDGVNPKKGEKHTQTFADFFFSATHTPVELPNVTSIRWTRSVDTDAAEVRIELLNTVELPVGVAKAPSDLQGYLSPRRGTTSMNGRWGDAENAWKNLLVPDNLIRTYEGWGSQALGKTRGESGFVPPEKDSYLVQTGLWIIDEVNFDATTGKVTIVARDPGRLLLDQIAMAPVIPSSFYPLTFKDWNDSYRVRYRTTKSVDTVEKMDIKHLGSGNDKWPESAYVGAKVYGHSSTHAFDGKKSTYWLSVGNGQVGWRSAYEYLDIGVKGTVAEVGFHTVKSGYKAYISVETKDGWVSGKTMPYRQDGRGRYEEGVPYVAYAARLDGEGEHRIKLKKPIEGARRVRIWLGNLQYFNLPGAKYRAAIREVAVYTPAKKEVKVSKYRSMDLTPGPAGANPGRVNDYTDIVKLFCAWAGLFWPRNGRLRASDGTSVSAGPSKRDTATLGKGVAGAVWGDFEAVGTAPVSEIPPNVFDKKSLMDGVRYIAEALGFIFYFDELGRAQWRLPNIYTPGNNTPIVDQQPGVAYPAYIQPPSPTRWDSVITLDESISLIELSQTLQSRNVREGVFVANPTGKFSALVAGFNPNPVGLRRFGGWSDVNFEDESEAQVMADMIAVRQMFRYQTNRLQIPAHPAIQINDQVRIVERVTAEAGVHYVKTISSSNEGDTWTYTLDTHWLGTGKGAWAFDANALEGPTRFLVAGRAGQSMVDINPPKKVS